MNVSAPKRAPRLLTFCLLFALLTGSTSFSASAGPGGLFGSAFAPAWTTLGGQEGAGYGYDVRAAGDVNGDGYDDVMVGAPHFSDGEFWEGAATLYYGAPGGPSTIPDWSVESDRDGTELGGTVGTVGDVNDDGYDDVVVGAEFYSDRYWYGGAIWVYYGSADGIGASADWMIEGEGEAAILGAQAGNAGDVNGDGIDDLIVSAYGLNEGRGRVYVYHGSESGLGESPDWIADGPQDGERFGWAAAAAGDVNGDGYDDVVIGANGYDSSEVDAGRVYLYYGSAAGLHLSAGWTIEGDQHGAWLGAAAGGAGDLNSDGYDDLAIGAPNYSDRRTDEGAAYVYYGGADGPSTASADWTQYGGQPRAEWGNAVGAAGDVNGDGYGDLLIAAHQYDHGQTDEGLVLVYFGGADGLGEHAAWVGEGDQATAGFGISAAGAGDVNGDGADDLIVGAYLYDAPLTNEGQATLWYGSQSPAQPALQIAPRALDVLLPAGQTLTRTVRLRNDGTGSVRYQLGPALLVTPGPYSQDGHPAQESHEVPLEQAGDKVEPGLREQIARAPGAKGTFLVYLQEQADLSGADQIDDWIERGRWVRKRLWETARASQDALARDLDRHIQSQAADGYRRFYIVNALLVTAGPAVLDELAARPDVAAIRAPRPIMLPDPPGEEMPSDVPAWAGPTATFETPNVPAHLRKIGVDRVWDRMGRRGQNVVVANIDSGVEYTHSLLIEQYRGTSTGSHDYNWFDATGTFTAPGDDHGHGTATMGILVGGDEERHVGVAPRAQWIAAKGCTNVTCYRADLLEAAEWILAPYPIGGTPADGDPDQRPHVVNNSWGGLGGDPWFEGVIAAWRAADILPVFAAGNCREGETPPCPLHSPGDYAGSLSVGATDSNEDGIKDWSSRGPSTLTAEVKPDLTAPGEAWTSVPGNRTGYSRGTSIAAPHAAGCAALILSADPDLSVEEVVALLIGAAADLGAPGPDPDYGHGRLDCYTAVARARLPWLSIHPLPGSRLAPAGGEIPPGGTLDLAVVFAPREEDLGHLNLALLPIYSSDPAALHSDLTIHMTVLSAGDVGLVSGAATGAASGRPVAATISALDTGYGAPIAAESDPDGVYTLWLLPGAYSVQATAAGYITQTVDVDVVVKQMTVQDFVMHTLTLDSLAATPAGDHVLIVWETEIEAGTAGFNLLRGQDAGGPYLQINETLIPAVGGPLGAVYGYEDHGVLYGTTTYYMLQDVDRWGHSTVHGPVSAWLDPRDIYLPLVIR